MAKYKPEVVEDRTIEVADWCGFPTYHCPLCDYDSTIESKTVEHLASAHPLPVEPDVIPVVVPIPVDYGVTPEPIPDVVAEPVSAEGQ